jgi:hypothetical protein
MIADLELRLAGVIGAALPAPFTGRVSVSPGPLSGADPAVVLGTTSFTVLAPDFGSDVRPEHAPPVADPRRVVRASCALAVEVRQGDGQGRPQQIAGLDALLYLLDSPEFRTGTALVDGADHGFLLDSLQVLDGRTEVDHAVPDQPPVALTLAAVGWFWPPGTPGASGPAITDVRIHGLAPDGDVAIREQP